MATEAKLPPSASCLSASLRDIGYSLETAIADIIDNSISAKATEIDIFCLATLSEPYVAILDNGIGMSESELLVAMRHGAKSPLGERSADDLGRFGLGLKTASFSQCRSLTVISRRDDSLHGAEWDLDLIDERDDWVIKILEDSDVLKYPIVDKLPASGTLVLWRKLDRLLDTASELGHEENINEALAILRRHLALVFHRYLAGEIKGKKINIRVNGDPIKPQDPFLKRNLATQVLPEEKIKVKDAEVRIQPYILPHSSNLDSKEYDQLYADGNLFSNQGCYVYRNGRLLAWADWFRITPKLESTKLARVQIDFPNSLDEAWTIDIKKSRANPPPQVREKIKKIITSITDRSKRVNTGRAENLNRDSQIDLWLRQKTRNQIIYEVNADHPLAINLKNRLAKEDGKLLNLFMETLSTSLPVLSIYSDYSQQPKSLTTINSESNKEKTFAKLMEWLVAIDIETSSDNAKIFKRIIAGSHMFEGMNELVDEFIKENFK